MNEADSGPEVLGQNVRLRRVRELVAARGGGVAGVPKSEGIHQDS